MWGADPRNQTDIFRQLSHWSLASDSRMIGRNVDTKSKGSEARSSGSKSAEGIHAQAGSQAVRGKALMPIPIEAAVSHVVTAGVGWLAIRFFRAFKRQQHTLQIASGKKSSWSAHKIAFSQLIRGFRGRSVHFHMPCIAYLHEGCGSHQTSKYFSFGHR